MDPKLAFSEELKTILFSKLKNIFLYGRFYASSVLVVPNSVGNINLNFLLELRKKF